MEKRLPNNWSETKFTNLISFIIGGDWGYDSEKVIEDSSLVYCIRGGEIRDWNKNKGNTAALRRLKNTSIEKRKLNKGDILVEISGGGPDQPVGRTLYIDEDSINNKFLYPTVCTNFFRLVRTFKPVDSKYINYYLHYFYIIGGTIELQGGSNNLRNLKIKEYQQITIPLPPLAEQKRIADKLDILFGRLETIRKATDHIPELIKKIRQQILTNAVTGKLTEKWRQKKVFDVCDIVEVIDSEYDSEDIPDTWIYSTIENVGKVKGGKRLPAGEELVEQNTGFPYIRARDLKEGTVLTKNMMYLLPETQQKIKSYIVKTDDVYITIVGAKIGDAGIIPESMNNANLTENAAKITLLHQDLYAHYLSLWLRASICQKKIQESIKSAAQGKLALARINKLPIYLPPKKEQEEIVSRVQSLFEKLKTIEQKFQMLKTKLDNLPQVLLHKAFKGELVEQLPTDGNAADLLREIEQLQKSIKKK